MMEFALGYILVGFVLALFCSSQWHRDPTIPWWAFVITMFVWPQTLYYIIKARKS